VEEMPANMQTGQATRWGDESMVDETFIQEEDHGGNGNIGGRYEGTQEERSQERFGKYKEEGKDEKGWERKEEG
jgi:hypothetical protein